jgi:hypothetical protein
VVTLAKAFNRKGREDYAKGAKKFFAIFAVPWQTLRLKAFVRRQA